MDNNYTVKIHKLPDYKYVRKVLYDSANPDHPDYKPREYHLWAAELEIIDGTIHAINADGLHGLINIKGETVLPFVYDDIYADRWHNVYGRRMVVKFTRETKAEFAKLNYAENYAKAGIHWWGDDELYYPEIAGFCKCRCGLADLNGNELLPCEYQAMEIFNGAVLAMQNWRWQIFDMEGRLLTTQTYDYNGAYATAVKKGFIQTPIAEKNPRPATTTTDANIPSEHTGQIVHCDNGDGCWTQHYINDAGKITVPSDRRYIEKVGKKLLRVNGGIYDEDGHEIIAPRRGKICVTPNGKFVTLAHDEDLKKNRENLIYDEDTGVYTRLDYTYIEPTAYPTLFRTANTVFNGKYHECYYGIIRDDGEAILPAEYEFTIDTCDSLSNFYFGKKDGRWYYIEIVRDSAAPAPLPAVT